MTSADGQTNQRTEQKETVRVQHSTASGFVIDVNMVGSDREGESAEEVNG